MHNDNLHEINEYLLLSSPFVFKVTPYRIASCISQCIQNTPKCHKPNKTKEKNVVLKTTIHTNSLRNPNFIPLLSVFCTSVHKEFSTTNGKNSAASQRIACFLNELRQPVVETPCRHICNGRVESFFKVFLGKKAAGFQNTGLH